MSVDAVKKHLAGYGLDDRIMLFDEDTSTVLLAAQVVGVIPARIAKTLSFKTAQGDAMLIVAAGDAKVNNRKFKDEFGFKATMLSADEESEKVGHPVGGVCPFAVNPNVSVYLDESLKRFDSVYPAAGNAGSAVRLTPDELFKASEAIKWIDVCKIPENNEEGNDK